MPFTPVVTTYTGNSFSHAHVTGAGPLPILLNASTGEYALAEMQHGSGHVLFGGMTTHNFHEPSENGEAANLRANIIAYSANFTPVPEPASVVLMISGLVGMVVLGRNRRQRANG